MMSNSETQDLEQRSLPNETYETLAGSITWSLKAHSSDLLAVIVVSGYTLGSQGSQGGQAAWAARQPGSQASSLPGSRL